MKTFNKKKGFTIIELVIVIAVIGVLTAILIPTFVNLTNKANKAADESLVTNLNKALAIEENEPGNEKNVTMHNAVLDLENEGYKLSQLVTKSGQDLVWSMDENRFHLDNGSYSGANFWKIYHKAADIDGKFSAYAGHDWPEADASVTLEKTGFDVGFNEGIAKVVFDHSAGTSAVDVTIRTNSVSAETSDANLTVTAFTDETSSDTIRHYGLAGYVHVIQGGAHSFHAHSTIGFAKVEKGRFVADSGAVVKQAYVTTSEAILTKEGDGIYENMPYAATEAIKNGHEGVPLQYDSEATEESIKEAGIEGVTPAPEGIAVTNDNLATVFSENGTYYLKEDIEWNRTIALSADSGVTEITLDLAGHVMHRDNTKVDGALVFHSPFFELNSSGAIFTLIDTVGNGSIDNQLDVYSEDDDQGQLSAIASHVAGCTVNINGGTLIGRYALAALNGVLNIGVRGAEIRGCIATEGLIGAKANLTVAGTYHLYSVMEQMGFGNIGYTIAEGLTEVSKTKHTDGPAGTRTYYSIVIA